MIFSCFPFSLEEAKKSLNWLGRTDEGRWSEEWKKRDYTSYWSDIESKMIYLRILSKKLDLRDKNFQTFDSNRTIRKYMGSRFQTWLRSCRQSLPNPWNWEIMTNVLFLTFFAKMLRSSWNFGITESLSGQSGYGCCDWLSTLIGWLIDLHTSWFLHGQHLPAHVASSRRSPSWSLRHIAAPLWPFCVSCSLRQLCPRASESIHLLTNPSASIGAAAMPRSTLINRSTSTIKPCTHSGWAKDSDGSSGDEMPTKLQGFHLKQS